MKWLAASFVFVITQTVNAQSSKIILDKIIATVNDHVVLRSDVINNLEDDKRLNSGISKLSACNSVQEIIRNKVLLSQAENENINIAEEEIEHQLNRRVSYYTRLLGGEAEFERRAGKSIYAFKEELRNPVRDEMLIEEIANSITEKVKITPSEVVSYYNSIPQDQLPFVETKYSIDQLVYYPKASAEMHSYVITELRKYKDQVATGKISFERLVSLYSDTKQSEYDLKRTDKTWDEGFLSAVFKLREGEISDPIKSGETYYLAKSIYREGDNMRLQLIAKTPAITDYDLKLGLAHLDSTRAKIIAGTITFNQAVSKFSNDENTKYSISVLDNTGQPSLTFSAMDKELVEAVNKTQVGQISQPFLFRDNQSIAGMKLIYIRSKTNPHILNLKDDYTKIAAEAIEVKKREALTKWVESKKSGCSIIYNDSIFDECLVGVK